jgi:hypothetical protein
MLAGSRKSSLDEVHELACGPTGTSYSDEIRKVEPGSRNLTMVTVSCLGGSSLPQNLGVGQRKEGDLTILGVLPRLQNGRSSQGISPPVNIDRAEGIHAKLRRTNELSSL